MTRRGGIATRLKMADIVPTIDAVNAYRLGNEDYREATERIDIDKRTNDAYAAINELEQAVRDIALFARRKPT